MRLICSRKTLLALRPTQIEGEPMRLAVGVHVLVPLASHREVVFDEQDVGELFIAGGVPSDEGFAKGSGEFLVAGKAFSSGAKPQPAVLVRARIGPLDKSILAIGDRTWKRGVATDPVPFIEMPLEWARAFG